MIRRSLQKQYKRRNATFCNTRKNEMVRNCWWHIFLFYSFIHFTSKLYVSYFCHSPSIQTHAYIGPCFVCSRTLCTVMRVCTSIRRVWVCCSSFTQVRSVVYIPVNSMFSVSLHAVLIAFKSYQSGKQNTFYKSHTRISSDQVISSVKYTLPYYYIYLFWGRFNTHQIVPKWPYNFQLHIFKLVLFLPICWPFH